MKKDEKILKNFFQLFNFKLKKKRNINQFQFSFYFLLNFPAFLFVTGIFHSFQPQSPTRSGKVGFAPPPSLCLSTNLDSSSRFSLSLSLLFVDGQRKSYGGDHYKILAKSWFASQTQQPQVCPQHHLHPSFL